MWPAGGSGLLGSGRFDSPSSTSQSEAKWAAQLTELEKERSGLVHTVACREEEASALREQLEHTQQELSSTQASNRRPLGDQGLGPR